MAKLIVNPTSSSRREIALAKSLLSIGRDPGNDIVLPDAMVSRRHAVIEFRGSQYFLRDCNSSNGSLVNGDRVSERSLRDGDLVAIGTARLLFRDEPDVEAGAKVVQHPSSPRLVCPTCGADHRKGDQFCRQCGGPLMPSAPPKAVCASCGTVVPLPAKFCTACGRTLAPEDAAQPEAERPEPAPRAAEGSASAAVALDVPPSPSPAPKPERPSVVPVPQPAAAPIAPAPPAAVRPTSLPIKRGAPPRPPAAPGPRPERARRFPDTFRDSPQPSSSAPERAGFGRRLTAGLVDHLVVAIVQGVLLAPVLWYWWSRPLTAEEVPFLPIAVSLALVPVAVVVGCAYFVYGWGVHGATPGKALLGVVVEGEDGSFPIGVSRATVRFLGYLLSGALLGIGFLVIAFGGNGLHDRIAGTRVVRRERL